MAKWSGLGGVVAGIAFACLLLASPAAAARHPVGDLTPGVVQPPPPGLALHGDVRWGATASSSALTEADHQELRTADGYVVVVETSPGYEPSLAYDEELVAYLDSLLHGSELNGLLVYVATPSEMPSVCGAQAAACYLPLEEKIAIVGEAEYGGFPTSYIVAHEYGHRIEAYRRNPPFQGGPLNWGTKRWASVKHVCQGYLAGTYAPGNEGAKYYRNPGEAFAESYAWYHFGSGVTGWHWYPRLRPNAKAYAAIRADVLNPWRPVLSQRRGYIARRGAQRAYVLHPRYDGWVQVRMTGGGDLDLGLYDKRRHLVASSTRDGTSNEQINFVVCGERKLTLVVAAYRPRGRFQLRLKTP